MRSAHRGRESARRRLWACLRFRRRSRSSIYAARRLEVVGWRVRVECELTMREMVLGFRCFGSRFEVLGSGEDPSWYDQADADAERHRTLWRLMRPDCQREVAVKERWRSRKVERP